MYLKIPYYEYQYRYPKLQWRRTLRKNLPKLIEAVCNYKDIEIIIVDDGSTDDSINIIQNSKFKVQNRNLKLRVIKNKTNLGFSSTVNKGDKRSKGRYFSFAKH